MESLLNISTLPPDDFEKEACKLALTEIREELFQLQNVFYASSTKALLIVLQGVDASGKDGAIRHALSSMDPQGVRVTSFKRPTEEEYDHDFLWRIYPNFPARGMIRVFNRSYYEDVIYPTLSGDLDEESKAHRFQLINALEDHLTRSGTMIMKFFLHISQQEQHERIQDRLLRPEKRWKYSHEDIKALQRYDKYMGIYDDIIDQTSTCPWHIIPADKKWYRNYIIAKTVKEAMAGLDLRYPEVSE